MKIPLPSAGHWQKLKLNKAVKKSQLSSTYKDELQITLNARTEEQKKDIDLPSTSKIQQ